MSDTRLGPQAGDLVYRTIRDSQGEELLVICRTITPMEFQRYEKELGAIFGELRHQMSTFLKQTKRGYLYGRWISMLAPSGDFGWVHGSQCSVIDGELWQAFYQTIQLRAKIGHRL